MKVGNSINLVTASEVLNMSKICHGKTQAKKKKTKTKVRIWIFYVIDVPVVDNSVVG